MNRILSLIGVVLVVGCGRRSEPVHFRQTEDGAGVCSGVTLGPYQLSQTGEGGWVPACDSYSPDLRIEANAVEFRSLSVDPEGRYVDDAGLPYTGRVFSRDYTLWETRTSTRIDNSALGVAQMACQSFLEYGNVSGYESCINASLLIPVYVVTDTVRVKVGELKCWDSEPLPFVKTETLADLVPYNMYNDQDEAGISQTPGFTRDIDGNLMPIKDFGRSGAQLEAPTYDAAGKLVTPGYRPGYDAIRGGVTGVGADAPRGNRCTEQTVTELYSQTDGLPEVTLRFVGHLVEGRLEGTYETYDTDGQFDGRNSVSLDAM